MFGKRTWIILLLFILQVANCARNYREILEDECLDPQFDCVCLRWTKWITLGSPYQLYQIPQTYSSLVKFGRITAQINSIDICTVPVSSDCRVLVPYRQPEMDASQDYLACPYVLNEKISGDGLVQIRFLCWDGSCSCLEWSKWFNNDKPDDDGDIEILHQTISKEVWPCPQGTQPLDVECRAASGKFLHETNNNLLYCGLDGFKCLNDLQGDTNCNCDDYMVRFLCPKHTDEISTYKHRRKFDDFGGNCSRPNRPREKSVPFGRDLTLKSDKVEAKAKAATTNKHCFDLPIPPNYGPCIGPLTCPRMDVTKMGQTILKQRSPTNEPKRAHHQHVEHRIDCRRFPRAKECDYRLQRSSESLKTHIKGRKREVGLIYSGRYANLTYDDAINYDHKRRHQSGKVKSEDSQQLKLAHQRNHPESIGGQDQNPHNRWKHLPPYIHQTIPQYNQYHHNYYPLMVSTRQQKVGRYYGQNRQLPHRNYYRKLRNYRKRSQIEYDSGGN